MLKFSWYHQFPQFTGKQAFKNKTRTFLPKQKTGKSWSHRAVLLLGCCEVGCGAGYPAPPYWAEMPHRSLWSHHPKDILGCFVAFACK